MRYGEPTRKGATPYSERRARDIRRLVANGEVEWGGGYLYRPGQILVSATDAPRAESVLREFGGEPDERTNRLLRERGLDLQRWRLGQDAHVPDVVDRLRAVDEQQPLVAGPNHVVGSAPWYDWGGGGAPRPAGPLPRGEAKPPLDDKAAIAVLDTGVAAKIDSLHPDLLAHLTDPTGDWDVLDDDGDGFLDSGAGHGTFVLGILYQLAPGLRLDAEPVLGTHGFGDDLTVALGITQAPAGVVNLSFGGYTHDNMEPPGMRAALRAAGPDTVFVAAAGNHALTDPFWPAAFGEVIAVAALDTTGRRPVPATFTNLGDWVDVSAPGVEIHSTYVRGVWPGVAEGERGERFSGFARWDGTSFAAPQVAAAIAQRAADGGISPHQAAGELFASLRPLPHHPEAGLVYEPSTDLVYR
jgi:subtilisin family serine protease